MLYYHYRYFFAFDAFHFRRRNQNRGRGDNSLFLSRFLSLSLRLFPFSSSSLALSLLPNTLSLSPLSNYLVSFASSILLSHKLSLPLHLPCFTMPPEPEQSAALTVQVSSVCLFPYALFIQQHNWVFKQRG